jgi:transposase InsO family protein
MASYQLSVKTIKRSAGRTATAAAAAAYRVGERIECQREGRIQDYTRKQGIEETFIIAPENAREWAQDRAALWNAAEASETRSNSVTAREWELSLPFEISAEVRSQITRAFAEQRVSRYGVAVDLAIHAPNREGDQRNPEKGGGLIHHSDRGSQYLSIKYTERLTGAGIDPSVGTVGDSYDNALAESIIGLFKTEVTKLLGLWRSIGQLEWETLKWVGWYNTKRIHSAIGYVTPQEAEEMFYQTLNNHEKAA